MSEHWIITGDASTKSLAYYTTGITIATSAVVACLWILFSCMPCILIPARWTKFDTGSITCKLFFGLTLAGFVAAVTTIGFLAHVLSTELVQVIEDTDRDATHKLERIDTLVQFVLTGLQTDPSTMRNFTLETLANFTSMGGGGGQVADILVDLQAVSEEAYCNATCQALFAQAFDQLLVQSEAQAEMALDNYTEYAESMSGLQTLIPGVENFYEQFTDVKDKYTDDVSDKVNDYIDTYEIWPKVALYTYLALVVVAGLIPLSCLCHRKGQPTEEGRRIPVSLYRVSCVEAFPAWLIALVFAIASSALWGGCELLQSEETKFLARTNDDTAKAMNVCLNGSSLFIVFGEEESFEIASHVPMPPSLNLTAVIFPPMYEALELFRQAIDLLPEEHQETPDSDVDQLHEFLLEHEIQGVNVSLIINQTHQTLITPLIEAGDDVLDEAECAIVGKAYRRMKRVVCDDAQRYMFAASLSTILFFCLLGLFSIYFVKGAPKPIAGGYQKAMQMVQSTSGHWVEHSGDDW